VPKFRVHRSSLSLPDVSPPSFPIWLRITWLRILGIAEREGIDKRNNCSVALWLCSTMFSSLHGVEPKPIREADIRGRLTIGKGARAAVFSRLRVTYYWTERIPRCIIGPLFRLCSAWGPHLVGPGTSIRSGGQSEQSAFSFPIFLAEKAEMASQHATHVLGAREGRRFGNPDRATFLQLAFQLRRGC
jgi:hypothetical protein